MGGLCRRMSNEDEDELMLRVNALWDMLMRSGLYMLMPYGHVSASFFDI